MTGRIKAQESIGDTVEAGSKGTGNRTVIKPLPKGSNDIQHAKLILDMIGGYDIETMTEQEILSAALKACHL